MNDLELFAENELTPIEFEERAFHEGVVDDVKGGIEKLARIGDASLKVLRDKRLYRASHKTFEEYCQERFGFTRRQADRQVGFAGLLEDLRPMGLKTLPATERQVRPLTVLPTPDLQAQAWEQAQADSGKEQPSSREVAEAVAKVQSELKIEKQRSSEFKQESNERRKRIRELETQIGLLEKKPASSPVTVEVPPADYEAFKARAAELAAELETVKQEQARIVQSAIKAKMQDHRREVADLEQQKTMLEDKTKRMMDYLASLSSEVKRIETHREVINGCRLELINLAAFLQDMEPMTDADTIARWLALADMHEAAANSIFLVFKPAPPTLTVIQGHAI